MRYITVNIACLILVTLFSSGIIRPHSLHQLKNDESSVSAPTDTISDLTALLYRLADESENSLFTYHFRSFVSVYRAKPQLTRYEIEFLSQSYPTFNDSGVAWSAAEFSTYLNRKRPLIFSWESPTDEVVSLAWLFLPENWDSTKIYPLYVILHGSHYPYDNPIEYMTTYFKPDVIADRPFKDGFALYPWGRGNAWYEGNAKTDIWECLQVVEKLMKVDLLRKYLVGHSMGGFGSWSIAKDSAEAWAAVGVYAGALWYYQSQHLTAEAAQKLKNIPAYIVCGEQDNLKEYNLKAYDLLLQAGNPNTIYVSYTGDHTPLYEQWDNMHKWIKQFSREDIPLVVSGTKLLPGELKPGINYPNPFNPVTNINFEIPESSQNELVSLKVYDLLGKEVAVLINEYKPAGVYNIQFNAAGLASGIYIYSLKYGNSIVSGKMELIK